jgi:nucleoside-diphosphate-sugar epimerase
MHVLVTGAGGFVGRNAVAALRSMGHTVTAIVRDGPGPIGCAAVEVDLLAPGAAEFVASNVCVDALLHLAWTTAHGAYWSDLANLRWIAATVELVAALATRGTRRVCVAGTCFEYDWPEDRDCEEFETATACHTIYDGAKDACRRVTEQFARQMGLSFAWPRLFHLYGPGEHQDRLVASVCRAVIAGEQARCSAGAGLRDFMDVRDVGLALARIVTSRVEGPINVASGRPVRVRDVALMIGELAGRPDLIAIGKLPDRLGDPPRITASVLRLNQDVGFAAAYGLEDGLNDALVYWAERGIRQ